MSADLRKVGNVYTKINTISFKFLPHDSSSYLFNKIFEASIIHGGKRGCVNASKSLLHLWDDIQNATVFIALLDFDLSRYVLEVFTEQAIDFRSQEF